MTTRTYSVLCPFGGLGGGAIGFLAAEARLLGITARFRCVGGIDFDAEACVDFAALTGSPSLCADVATLTPDELRAHAGDAAPDVVFLSPPCKGASGLLSAAKANTAKYRRMNALALSWVQLMLATWRNDPPRLVLLENVPRLKQRAARMLSAVRAHLRRAGYVISDGFHDCGELGGLAQRRRRYLLVARHASRVAPLLYQPPKKRVRACGEVLSRLPMPTTEAAAEYGRIHEMPRLSWLNWVRLALIPAGGDWRDLAGVLAEDQARRELHRRHHVERWDDPSVTVAGSGSNGPSAVADPRTTPHSGAYGVSAWADTSGTITGEGHVSNGRFAVADPRFGDPRVVPQADNANMHWGKYVVREWTEPAPTVTGAGRVGSGAASVADSRIRTGFDRSYSVVPWTDPANTIAGGSHPGQGAFSVADPRIDGTPRAGAYGLISWDEAAKTVTGSASIDNGAWAVADPRAPEGTPPALVIRDVRKAPNAIPIIVAADGTWHRPLTTLELAALQGLPTRMPDGSPLRLAGSSSSKWRERIGNAVPPPAAQSIAERMLVALVEADLQAFALKNDGEVWVTPEQDRTNAGTVS